MTSRHSVASAALLIAASILSLAYWVTDSVAFSGDNKRLPQVWQIAQKPLASKNTTSTAKAAHCAAKAGIWADRADGGVRTIVYGTNGLIYPSDIYFEEWRGNKLAWRIKGQLECSNGVSTCYAAVGSKGDGVSAPTGEGAKAEGDDAPPMSHAVLETIDENDDGMAEFAVFAGLSQILHYDGGANVEWFNGFAPEANDLPASPANIYKFMGCRATEELELLEAPRTQLQPGNPD
jgi:hypothetical protein